MPQTKRKASSKKSKVSPAVIENPVILGEKLQDKIKKRYTDQIIFALCGPIGSPIHEVGEKLKSILLSKYGYDRVEIIRIGKYIPELGLKLKTKLKLNPNDRHKEVQEKIKVANDLRENFGNSFLAEFVIEKIHNDRSATRGEDSGETKNLMGAMDVSVNGQQIAPQPKEIVEQKVAYIIDSIKNQEELDILKLVYRDLLFFIGVFAPLKDRIDSLKRELDDEKEIKINSLIHRDSGEEIEHGMTVRDTFPQADFFIRVHNRNYKQIDTKLERFLNLIFDKEIVIPTYKETAMYLATSAARNSACLSRQVGAALTDEKGEVISIGWNDVPKFGGDLYKSIQSNHGNNNNIDHRCMNIDNGLCFNDREKNTMVNLIYNELKQYGVLAADNSVDLKKIQEKFPKDKRPKLIDIESITKHLLRNSKIKSLGEFSRSIHAEMHAIIMGSQLAGMRVKGSKLFVTTYPCHSCARHIIAAGIKDVYYIEPYTKSLTTKLHFDSITEDEGENNKVRLLLFEGVGPNRYFELFEMPPQRKQSGTGKMEVKSKIPEKPKSTMSLDSINSLEKVVVEHFKSHDEKK